MPDKEGESVSAEATEHKVEAASEAAASAAAQTAEIVETVKEGAAVAVAVAVEEAKAAEAVAEQIAKAAVETERGRQVEAIARDLVQCQNDLTATRATVEELKAAITSLSTTIALLTPPTIVQPQPEAPLQSRSPIPKAPETLEIVNPEAAISGSENGDGQKDQAQVPGRRKRNVI